MKRTIEVTNRDIDEGFTSSGKSCPIALAYYRCVGDDPIRVESDRIITDEHRSELVSYLPEKAQEFISDFDWSRQVEAFSFELSISDRISSFWSWIANDRNESSDGGMNHLIEGAD